MMQILVLIPAYNEALRIGPVIQSVVRPLPMLVVDDGSTDGTAALAEAAGARVLRQPVNRGKGAALLAGFGYALAEGYAAAITLDADGQHDPAEIPTFLERFAQTGAELIVGARDFRRMPPVRRLANSVGRWTFSWAAGREVLDNQSGYRLVGRRMMAAMLDAEEVGFEFEVEMLVRAWLADFPVEWVPIRTIYAGESSHIRPWQHTRNFFRLVWRTRQRMRQPADKG